MAGHLLGVLEPCFVVTKLDWKLNRPLLPEIDSYFAAGDSVVGSRPIKIVVFMISGALSGLAAVAYCARLASVDPNAGSGFELEAIAAVVIGGTSLMGGRGSVINSLFGVLVISVLETGLAQLGAQEPVKRLVTGGVIVAAVIVDFYRNRRAARAAQ